MVLCCCVIVYFYFVNSHNSVERSKALESLDRSVSTQEVVVASGEVDLNKEATLEDQEEETSCDRVDSPGTGDIVTQVLLDPSGGAPQGEDDGSSSQDVSVGLRKILDAQKENGTPRLMADAAELLVFRSPNDSEAFGCLVDKISSSERRFCAGVKLTKHRDITKDVPANDNQPLAVVPNQVSS